MRFLVNFDEIRCFVSGGLDESDRRTDAYSDRKSLLQDRIDLLGDS